MNKSQLRSFSLATATIAGVITSGSLFMPAFAQSVEPVYPMPSSTNGTLDSTTPIEVKLTEQPDIKLETIKVLLNGTEVSGNLSVNTVDKTLLFKATPSTFNIGDNTLAVSFMTSDAIQSEFSWSFALTGATTTTPTTTSTETTTPSTTETTTPTEIALKPELSSPRFVGSAMILEGKTRPNAKVTVDIQATRPGTSLFNLGSFRVGSSAEIRAIPTATVKADSQGNFRAEFDVVGDSQGTQYAVTTTAADGTVSESTTMTVTR
ncbi:MAG: hypothetical protein HC799_11680 [Limnothrix sp. RL_2_0]|nr:hypothetical protein [Limnothrix sp. RL_2_0]